VALAAPDVGVGLGRAERLPHGDHHLVAEGVADLGPVDAQHQHVAVPLLDELLSHPW
jgi:hypothetical protein